jgi:hypothetical protein
MFGSLIDAVIVVIRMKAPTATSRTDATPPADTVIDDERAL